MQTDAGFVISRDNGYDSVKLPAAAGHIKEFPHQRFPDSLSSEIP